MNTVGKIIIENNNEDNICYEREYTDKQGNTTVFRSVKIVQEVESYENGIFDTKRRVAFVTIKPATWDKHVSKFTHGATFPWKGKIVVEETLEQEYPTKEAKFNPHSGQTMFHKGLPIYRYNRFTPDVQALDVLLTADKAGAVISKADETSSAEDAIKQALNSTPE